MQRKNMIKQSNDALETVLINYSNLEPIGNSFQQWLVKQLFGMLQVKLQILL